MSDYRLQEWMRHDKEEDLSLAKGILEFFVIAAILFVCVYIAA